MKAAIYKGVSDIEVSEYELRSLREGEVLVNVQYCGICGTDKHIYHGEAYAKPPVILGHEYAGVIAGKDKHVDEFQVGDKVAVDPNIYCGECSYCKKGKISFCKNLQALGVSVNGGFAEYSVVPASQLYKLPNNFDLSVAAFAEPLSCCIRGINNAEIKAGDSVVIIGGGSIGLLMVQLVKLSGAAKIILIEPVESKREIAKFFGADFTISPTENEFIQKVIDYTAGGADVVIECVGKKETVECSVKLVDKGGRVVIFGLAPKHQTVELNLQELFLKEIEIHNSYLNPFTFNAAVDLLISKKVDVTKLVTNRIHLIDIPQFFNASNNSSTIKSQVIINNKEEV